MPDPSLLTPLGQQMLGSLPPILRNSIDYMAVIHAYAREIALLESSIEQVRRQFDPAQADILLNAHEAELKLPVGGNGATIAQRRALVLGRLVKLVSSGSGRDWESAVTGIVGSAGWSYLEHDPGNPSSPPDGQIQVTLPFASGTAQFAAAQTQIRDITDAHMQLAFVSTTTFQLDQSQLDLQAFNA